MVVQVLGAKFLAAARSSLSMSGAGASQELQQLAQDTSEPLLGLGAPPLHRQCGWCMVLTADIFEVQRSPLNNSQFSWTGKVVATSILNSSSLALTGGIGIMRLCLGELAFRTRLQALCMPAASKHRLIRRVAEG